MNGKICLAIRKLTYPDGYTRITEYEVSPGGTRLCTGERNRYKRLKREYKLAKQKQKLSRFHYRPIGIDGTASRAHS